MGTGEFVLGVTLRWTSIPSSVSRNTPSRFMLRKPEISAGLMSHLGSNADFTYRGRVTNVSYDWFKVSKGTINQS